MAVAEQIRKAFSHAVENRRQYTRTIRSSNVFEQSGDNQTRKNVRQIEKNAKHAIAENLFKQEIGDDHVDGNHNHDGKSEEQQRIADAFNKNAIGNIKAFTDNASEII